MAVFMYRPWCSNLGHLTPLLAIPYPFDMCPHHPTPGVRFVRYLTHPSSHIPPLPRLFSPTNPGIRFSGTLTPSQPTPTPSTPILISQILVFIFKASDTRFRHPLPLRQPFSFPNPGVRFFGHLAFPQPHPTPSTAVFTLPLPVHTTSMTRLMRSPLAGSQLLRLPCK